MKRENIFFPEDVGPMKFIFENLLTDDIRIQKISATSISNADKLFVATYKDDDSFIQLLVFIEFPIALGLAGMLTRFMPDVVSEALRKDSVPKDFLENLYEISNILAHCFNQNGFEHIALHELKLVNLGDPLYAFLSAPTKCRLDCNLKTFNGYGDGNMTFLQLNDPYQSK